MRETLLVAWGRFNKYEQQAIIKWVIQDHPHIQPGHVPFQKLTMIFEVLDRADAQIRQMIANPNTIFTAPRRFKAIILESLYERPSTKSD